MLGSRVLDICAVKNIKKFLIWIFKRRHLLRLCLAKNIMSPFDVTLSIINAYTHVPSDFCSMFTRSIEA